MSKEILKYYVVKPEKKYRYYIDYNGHLCRKRERLIFNVWTLITILVIIAGISYYVDTNQCRETLNHLDKICIYYNLNDSMNYRNYTYQTIPINFSKFTSDG